MSLYVEKRENTDSAASSFLVLMCPQQPPQLPRGHSNTNTFPSPLIAPFNDTDALDKPDPDVANKEEKCQYAGQSIFFMT